jgi:hypothetical protein
MAAIKYADPAYEACIQKKADPGDRVNLLYPK